PWRARFSSALRSFPARSLRLRAARRLTSSAIAAAGRLFLAEGIERDDVGRLARLAGGVFGIVASRIVALVARLVFLARDGCDDDRRAFGLGGGEVRFFLRRRLDVELELEIDRGIVEAAHGGEGDFE